MIQVKNISAGYAGKTIIQDISLDFVPGEVLVLLGPNGSGKTTLLKAALGLISHTDGVILYDGEDMKQMNRKQIAQKASLLSQSRNVPSIQAFRMVLHGRFPYLSYPRTYREEDKKIARKAMEETGCSEYANYNVNELSGGQRQAVYLAMALAQDTDTVFMDEPTTYLDIYHQVEILELVKELNEENELTVIMVLHDINQAIKYSDNIIVMKSGQAVACGKADEIINMDLLNNVYKIGGFINKVENERVFVPLKL
jgi:iron complex transport system ATP-binding protein